MLQDHEPDCYTLPGRLPDQIRRRHLAWNGIERALTFLLLDERITDAAAAERALERLRAMGPVAVLLKGGHLEEGPWVVDRYAGDDGCCRFEHARIPVEGHGTGCTLASSIAAQLCHGLTVHGACEAGTAYIARALASSYRPGLGPAVVLDHFGAARAP